jgi:hypothetical protein
MATSKTIKPLFEGMTGNATSNTRKVKIGRDAKTGRFIPVGEAEKRPDTTTVETVKRRKRGGGD